MVHAITTGNDNSRISQHLCQRVFRHGKCTYDFFPSKFETVDYEFQKTHFELHSFLIQISFK